MASPSTSARRPLIRAIVKTSGFYHQSFPKLPATDLYRSAVNAPLGGTPLSRPASARGALFACISQSDMITDEARHPVKGGMAWYGSGFQPYGSAKEERAPPLPKCTNASFSRLSALHTGKGPDPDPDPVVAQWVDIKIQLQQYMKRAKISEGSMQGMYVCMTHVPGFNEKPTSTESVYSLQLCETPRKHMR
ncbi:hypothetical protein BJX66DRAFT_310782 [Aspergillus keveii]|uniref:Uncharacterized protein n=1 Tax=Aspergillus keveii TaxID=714993 RepID=A0ABR4FW17_9EURO